MQLILTYIIVAIALVFAGRGKDAVVIAVAGEKERIKKAACKSSFFYINACVCARQKQSIFFFL